MDTPNTEGVPLYYEVLGDGQPLLLLPGAGQAAVTFVESGFAAELARHFRVVLMDVSGMGRSGRVTEVTPSQWAQDAISVLDALGLERAHLGGSSLGARIAARVAADQPDRVDRLLVDMPITGADEQQERALHAFFADYATNSLAAPARRWHGERWREAMDLFVATRSSRVFRDHYHAASYIADIRAPTLICRGDTPNPVHPVSQAADWHAASQRSWLWIEPGASNMALTQACPDRVASTFARFVTQSRRPA
jgi:pimeloyl-ACP methyl ester carboxylesterase